MSDSVIAQDVIKQQLPARRWLPTFRHLATLLGVAIVGAALLVAIFAPYLTPHDPFAQDLNLRLIPPVWMDGSQPEHLLGTDQIGIQRDAAVERKRIRGGRIVEDEREGSGGTGEGTRERNEGRKSAAAETGQSRAGEDQKTFDVERQAASRRNQRTRRAADRNGLRHG